ncbi:hypothetical protein BC826DRAFT_1017016 [Russula brevipes]|nr:hypothetical protein BC826DRAFT_1017016 [Russula brevipes]
MTRLSRRSTALVLLVVVLLFFIPMLSSIGPKVEGSVHDWQCADGSSSGTRALGCSTELLRVHGTSSYPSAILTLQ